MSLCDACITGVRHEGVPVGHVEKIAGVDVYVVAPEGEYAKEKALLYLPDALGLPLVNAQWVYPFTFTNVINRQKADDFARNGFQVFMIDVFNGDPFPMEYVDAHNKLIPSAKVNIQSWVQNHNDQVTRPLLDAVISALKARGITDFGATGYCFGGKYVFKLAQENVIKAGIASHPSLLEFPGDIEKLAAESQAAMLINSCEVDTQFPAEACALTDKILGDGKYSPGYKRVHWEGCEHGFAVRGDMNNPKIKAGKEGAFAEAVGWLKRHL